MKKTSKDDDEVGVYHCLFQQVLKKTNNDEPSLSFAPNEKIQ
jgi:hypothetical protein